MNPQIIPLDYIPLRWNERKIGDWNLGTFTKYQKVKTYGIQTILEQIVQFKMDIMIMYCKRWKLQVPLEIKELIQAYLDMYEFWHFFCSELYDRRARYFVRPHYPVPPILFKTPGRTVVWSFCDVCGSYSYTRGSFERVTDRTVWNEPFSPWHHILLSGCSNNCDIYNTQSNQISVRVDPLSDQEIKQISQRNGFFNNEFEEDD